jgi:hypothetical protein
LLFYLILDIAKDLKLRRRDIYYYVIGLFVMFGLPLMTMDTATATIVAGGRVSFMDTQMLIEIDL